MLFTIMAAGSWLSARSPEQTCSDANEHAAQHDKRTTLPGSRGGNDVEEASSNHHQ
jgi:hypothetical protein